MITLMYLSTEPLLLVNISSSKKLFHFW